MGGFSLLVSAAGSLLIGGVGPDKCHERATYSKADDGESFEIQAERCADRLNEAHQFDDRYCTAITVGEYSHVMCYRLCSPVKRIFK